MAPFVLPEGSHQKPFSIYSHTPPYSIDERGGTPGHLNLCMISALFWEAKLRRKNEKDIQVTRQGHVAKISLLCISLGEQWQWCLKKVIVFYIPVKPSNFFLFEARVLPSIGHETYPTWKDPTGYATIYAHLLFLPLWHVVNHTWMLVYADNRVLPYLSLFSSQTNKQNMSIYPRRMFLFNGN